VATNIFRNLRDVANALTGTFEKKRRDFAVKNIRGVINAVAKRSRKKAYALREVKGARYYNKNIKVIINTKARWSESRQAIIAGIAAHGIVAKIELGMKAKRFWLYRRGNPEIGPKRQSKAWKGRRTHNNDTFVFRGATGAWTSVGRVQAGGQTFKKREIVEITHADKTAITNALGRAITGAAQAALLS